MVELDDLKEIKEWVLIERINDEGVVEILERGDFDKCRDAARQYEGDNEISLVPYDDFSRKARLLH